MSCCHLYVNSPCASAWPDTLEIWQGHITSRPFRPRVKNTAWMICICKNGDRYAVNILDHKKTQTYCLTSKACWENTGLWTRNGGYSLQDGRWTWNKQVFLAFVSFWVWAFGSSKSSKLWKTNSCKANTSSLCQAHTARAIPSPLLRGQIALTGSAGSELGFKEGKATSDQGRSMCEVCMWQLHICL